ncbi:MAG: DUF6691 family protein [bacterium]
MKVVIASFVSGLLFAIGLGLAGMTNPSKVIGFLDFFGHWDPTFGVCHGRWDWRIRSGVPTHHQTR